MYKPALVSIAILVCCTVLRPTINAQEKPESTLEQDRQKLEGLWRTEGFRKKSAEGWQCQAAVGLKGSESPRLSLTINFERGNQASSGPVLGSQVQLKEKDGKRWFALNPTSAKEVSLPEEILYRFDGDILVLKLEQGKCKGEYKLNRVKKD